VKEHFSQLTAISRILFYLRLYFTCAFVFSSVLLARKRSKALICYSHFAHSNITKHKFVVFFPHFSFLILHSAFCILHFTFNQYCSLEYWLSRERGEMRSGGVAFGQIKYPLKFCIIPSTKVFAKLFPKSVSLCTCVYGAQT